MIYTTRIVYSDIYILGFGYEHIKIVGDLFTVLYELLGYDWMFDRQKRKNTFDAQVK